MSSTSNSKKKSFLAVGIVLCFLMAGLSAFGILWIINHHSADSSGPDTPEIPAETPDTPELPPEPEVILPPAVNLQPVVDEWVSSVGGNRSVIIYDIDRDEIAASYNPDEEYSTASLYKLFVVYEGYKRLQTGEWIATDTAGWTGNNILECLDLAIRESYSPCAETLWNEIGHEELDAIITNNYGIVNSDISHLVSTPADILKIMQLFYKHPDFSDEELVARMKDSFLNQPTTTYNWRQGLPSGFSEAVNVYNKVGWDFNPDGNYWNIYHDTAILDFTELNRHFIAVVMTNRVSFQKIRDLGTMIEEAVYAQQSTVQE